MTRVATAIRPKGENLYPMADANSPEHGIFLAIILPHSVLCRGGKRSSIARSF